MNSHIAIRAFQDLDIEPLALILVNMWARGGAYPPPEDVDGTLVAMKSWLLEEEASRWVITVDDIPAGHILLSPAHEYLYSHLQRQGKPHKRDALHEVGKFFVDPQHRKHGLGHRLFDHLTQQAQTLHQSVALSVIETSKDALHFYRHKGLREEGSFLGRHGLNYVFMIT